MCGSCRGVHSGRRAAWFWGAVGVAALVAGLAFTMRLEHSNAASSRGPCDQAHAAYRTLGTSLTLALAKNSPSERASMLRATTVFSQDLRGSRCAAVVQIRRQARLDLAGFCEPCARALTTPARRPSTYRAPGPGATNLPSGATIGAQASSGNSLIAARSGAVSVAPITKPTPRSPRPETICLA